MIKANKESLIQSSRVNRASKDIDNDRNQVII